MPSIGSATQVTALVPTMSLPSSPTKRRPGERVGSHVGSAAPRRRRRPSPRRSGCSWSLDDLDDARAGPSATSRPALVATSSARSSRSLSRARHHDADRGPRRVPRRAPVGLRAGSGSRSRRRGPSSAPSVPTAARRTGSPRSAPARSSKQVAHDGDERRMDAGGRGPPHRQSESRGGRGGLGVEVVDDLHVVGHEADRDDHDRRRAGLRAAPPGGR